MTGRDRNLLGPAFCGMLIYPTDPCYTASTRVWRKGVDRRPHLISRCTSPSDIALTVRFASEVGRVVCVRGGGHSFAGHGVWDDAVMIDLSLMNKVRVDAEAEVALVGPGACWGHLDKRTQEFGLATTGADSPEVGVSGMTLGGGLGALHRVHGLSCDNLVSAEVVTADAEVLRVSATENADLFWALRGGGGNFGVVSGLHLRLHPVRSVVIGLIVFPFCRAREAMSVYRDVCLTAPDELLLRAFLMPAPHNLTVPRSIWGDPVLAISITYFGIFEDARSLVQPFLRAYLRPTVASLRRTSYLAMQQEGKPDEHPGFSQQLKSEALAELDDGLIEVLVTAIDKDSRRLSAIVVSPLGGAVSRVALEQTPFPFRAAAHILSATRIWPHTEGAECHLSWIDRLWECIASCSAGGTYVNHLDDEGEVRVRGAYGTNYRRLSLIKAVVDPNNMFRANQNIPPADIQRLPLN